MILNCVHGLWRKCRRCGEKKLDTQKKETRHTARSIEGGKEGKQFLTDRWGERGERRR